MLSELLTRTAAIPASIVNAPRVCYKRLDFHFTVSRDERNASFSLGELLGGIRAI